MQFESVLNELYFSQRNVQLYELRFLSRNVKVAIGIELHLSLKNAIPTSFKQVTLFLEKYATMYRFFIQVALLLRNVKLTIGIPPKLHFC